MSVFDTVRHAMFTFEKFTKKSKKFTPDLSTWNFELDDMWNIIGVNLERANEMIKDIQSILEKSGEIAFKDLCKKALETLPKNKKEYTWLVFYLGQRFQLVLIEKGIVVIAPVHKKEENGGEEPPKKNGQTIN